jgi:hypothetical protein
MRWIKTEEEVENEAKDETDDEAESCLCLPWFILVHLGSLGSLRSQPPGDCLVESSLWASVFLGRRESTSAMVLGGARPVSAQTDG